MMTLDIEPANVGSIVGSGTVEGKINCRFDLELVAIHPEGLEIWAQDSCTGSDVGLFLDGTFMYYGGRNPGEPEYWLRATLNRS
jgi:hypothetical protein